MVVISRKNALSEISKTWVFKMAAAAGFATRRIDVPGATSPMDYSPRLTRTINYINAHPNRVYFHDKRKPDFYDTLKVAADMSVADGRLITPPDAGEEQEVYVKKGRGVRKLSGVKKLQDYFGMNNGNWLAWGHTLTALRFEKDCIGQPYRIGKEIPAKVIVTKISKGILRQVADPQFTRDNWKDVIEEVNIDRGEVAVPYARGSVIEEMYPVLGVWKRISDTDIHEAPYALHGWLAKNLDIPQDKISGHYDVAVMRGRGWPHTESCLNVDAHYWRWGANSDVGFRPVVRGSVSEGKIAAIHANLGRS